MAAHRSIVARVIARHTWASQYHDVIRSSNKKSFISFTNNVSVLSSSCLRCSPVRSLSTSIQSLSKKPPPQEEGHYELGTLADQILRDNRKGANEQQQEQEQQQEYEEETEEAKAKREKFEKERKEKWKKWAMRISVPLLIGSGISALYTFGAPTEDEFGNRIPDEFDDSFAAWGYIQRAYHAYRNYRTMIVEPSRDLLLPDPLTEPYYQPPYTLVIELTNVLVHPEWTYAHGWRFKKRPGIDYFLSQVGPPLFEVVVFTSEQGFTAFPIIDSLDPQGYVMYRLFRDSTRYHNKHHIKDLSCLNRDLSKVIIVDWDQKSYQVQPRNAVGLKKWEGNMDDRTLFDLANFLRTLASSGVDDVRTVLDYYKSEDDPLEAFKKNQALLQEKQIQQAQELAFKENNQSTSFAGAWTKKLIGR